MAVQGKGRGRVAYEMRVSSRISWAEIASELGYSSHKGASTSARSYARREGFPWPIKSITKGESIYRCKRLGMSWMKISQRYGQSIKAVQRCAYKYAKRNTKQWPPK
jgi:hypothetical protein